MQSERHLYTAVLLYLFILVVLVIYNLFKDANILDYIYFLVVVCSVLKIIMIIIKESRN